MPRSSPSLPVARLASRSEAYVELAKVRIAALVLVTTAIGFVLAGDTMDRGRFAVTLAGTLLAAAGANAWNQAFERRQDARMARTAGRPLPTGRLRLVEAHLFALAASSAGVLLLARFTTPLAAVLTTATVVLYAFVYTPLKRKTPLCTWIGAVPGALPPLIGAAAVSPGFPRAELWLFFVLLFWQVPHFYAIAWRYRDDYLRGGFPMLPVVDRRGRRTGLESALATAGLLGAALWPAATHALGTLYLVASLVLGGAFAATVAVFLARRSDRSARRVFFASILYLPLLLAVVLVDRLA